jgi:hypothetical protein
MSLNTAFVQTILSVDVIDQSVQNLDQRDVDAFRVVGVEPLIQGAAQAGNVDGCSVGLIVRHCGL